MTDTDRIDIPTSNGAVPVDVVRPAGGTGPGLVLCHEIFGVTDYMLARAGDLADLGYTVYVPHFYWREAGGGEAEVVSGGGQAALDRGLELAGGVVWPLAVKDAQAALDRLTVDPATGARAGLFGFCWGGGLAFATTAIADPDVLVSYYGSALPALVEQAVEVSAPSLHHFGTDDAFIPPQAQAEVRAALERDGVEWHEWEGAGHAFDNPLPEYHDAEASVGAWAVTQAWLERNFPV